MKGGFFSLPCSITSRTFSLYTWVHVRIGSSVISKLVGLSLAMFPYIMYLEGSMWAIVPVKLLYHGCWEKKISKNKIIGKLISMHTIPTEMQQLRYLIVWAWEINSLVPSPSYVENREKGLVKSVTPARLEGMQWLAFRWSVTHFTRPLYWFVM